MKITKENIKKLAIGAAAVSGVVIVGMLAHNAASNMYILKNAKWTAQGDMLLTFYNRDNGMLIPKPE